jgi:hypothetical protein
MFVTGAFSSLIPYLLFFGMLMLFALKTYTHTPQLSEDSNEHLLAENTFHLEKNKQYSSEKSADYLSFLSKKFQKTRQLCFLPTSLNVSSLKFNLFSVIKPSLSFQGTIELRGPPASR